MDPLYLSVLVSAEKKFWRCVQSGEVPHLIMAEPPRPRIEAIRIVDMSSSNSWAEFAALFRNTREAFLDHERAKSELKTLMPEDAKEAIGHGVRAKRSKAGAVTFDVRTTEAAHAPGQGIGGRARLGRGQRASRTRQPGKVIDRNHPERPARGRASAASAMRRYRAASTSCARHSANTRSQRCRPRRSTRRQAWSICPPSSLTPRVNGLPPTGRYVLLPKLQIRSGWAPR